MSAGWLAMSLPLALLAGQGTFWMPERGSVAAGEVDWLFYFILYISTFFLLIIVLGLIYMVLRYRRRPGVEAEKSPDHNLPLELTWTLIPVVVVIAIFYLGFKTYMDEATPPANAYEIQVEGHKWQWAFTYPNGYVDSVLHVPLGQPVRLVVTSTDVIHSFFIPDFRIKKDAVPGRYTTIWFTATAPGEHDAFCTQYCGTGHSTMITKVVVQDPAEFEKWLAEAESALENLSPVDAGRVLTARFGCIQCHSTDGSTNTGPSWKGLYGRTVQLADGATVKADENYIRESILEPQAKVVAGFQPVMPTFQGKLKDKDVTALIEYIKTFSK